MRKFSSISLTYRHNYVLMINDNIIYLMFKFSKTIASK